MDWHLLEVYPGEGDLTFILCRGEAWFHHSGFVNSQSDGYHLLIHKEPFCDINVGVWCTLSAASIIGPPPFFFKL